jgi:hypothetical protein
MLDAKHERWSMPTQIGRWINIVKGWLGTTAPKSSSGGGKTASGSGTKPKQGKKNANRTSRLEAPL